MWFPCIFFVNQLSPTAGGTNETIPEIKPRISNILRTFGAKADSMKRPHIVEQIRKALLSVAPDAQAVLYGSEARGDAHPDSDIDLLVLVDGNSLSVEEEERIIAPLYDIEIETGMQINGRVLLKKLWEHRPFRTPFQVNVMNEGILL